MSVFSLVSQGQKFTLVILYIIQVVCTCMRACVRACVRACMFVFVFMCVCDRDNLLFPYTCPEHTGRVELNVGKSGYVCLLSEESLCEVLARSASLAGLDRGDLFLYPGLNYEDEKLPCC